MFENFECVFLLNIVIDEFLRPLKNLFSQWLYKGDQPSEPARVGDAEIPKDNMVHI